MKTIFICCNNIFINQWFHINVNQSADNKIASPTEVLAIEYKESPERQEDHSPSPSPPPPSEPVKVEVPPVQPPPDLLVIIMDFGITEIADWCSTGNAYLY